MKAKAEKAELVHGSGNLYADLRLPSPDLRDLRFAPVCLLPQGEKTSCVQTSYHAT